MKVEVMVSNAKCDDVRQKLKHLVDTDPKVSNPAELSGTTILVYEIAEDNGLFAVKAMQSGASSVSKTIT